LLLDIANWKLANKRSRKWLSRLISAFDHFPNDFVSCGKARIC